jgi:methyl-accepting chemotaxis protein
MKRMFEPLTTIRGRLWSGFAFIVLLLLVAGAVARTSMSSLSWAIASSLSDVQAESQLSAALSTNVAKTLAAGTRYLETRDPRAQQAFRSFGWSAHNIQRRLNELPGRTPEEIATVAGIDAHLSMLENHHALAHRLADLGRAEDAHAAAERAQPAVEELLAQIERLGQLQTQKVAATAGILALNTRRRSAMLQGLILFALIIAAVVVVATVRGVGRPLDILVDHARRLSEGDLTVRTRADMPGEFTILARAMNQTGDSLSRIVAVAARTAEEVASSAHQLASVSEQISMSAGQMATSMTEVSHGADVQVQQLRTVDTSLDGIRAAATSVKGASTDVTHYAHEIELAAHAKRQEIARALGILGSVKESVERAAAEVTMLNATTADINRFVQSVGQIAEQTNLLALNAAIEAARAGAAGRGFAVVADEVRKLAEQSQRAADDIVRMTGVITARVSTSARLMETSASRVGEITTVSHDIDQALATIALAAERTLQAALQLAEAAETNVNAVGVASEGVQAVARAAESHAATAEQVNASTEEQSAACEQMSSASTLLLEGSTQLRSLVGELRASATAEFRAVTEAA